MNALNALDAFVKGAPKKAKSVDDEAVHAFVRNVPEASKNTRCFGCRPRRPWTRCTRSRNC